MPPDPSRALDALYAASPAEFTKRRNALAAELRAAGKRDEAAAVGRLRKPSAPAWAINTAAREQPDAMRAFVDATDRLKRAGTREAMVEASRAQRGALQEILRAADQLLRREGIRPTGQTIERISRTLLGFAVDRAARSALLHGRLTEEREAPGFEGMTGARIEHAPEPRERAADAPRPTARDARKAHAAEEARARARELAERTRALEEEAETRRRAAAEAKDAVARLRHQLREAEARAHDLMQLAVEATNHAKRARREADRAAAKRPTRA